MDKALHQKLFRAGHLAKGIIYALLGFFAFAVLIGASSDSSGKQGAIQFIWEQPFGQILIGLLIVGLVSYAVWRWVEAYQNFQEEDGKKDSIGKPVAWIFSGLAYLALAFSALQLLLGNGGGSGGNNTRQDVISSILDASYGQVLVIIIGVVFVGVAFYQFYKGVKEKYMENIRTQSMSSKEQSTYRTIGKMGHIARAVVFLIIAYFLILAGIESDASEVKGTAGALQFLKQNAYGLWLMGITGLGLLAYGVFMLLKAGYGPK